jgi:hypothetical protein
MKVTKSQLIKIIKEELNEYGNYSAAAGADLRAAQLAGGGNPVQSEEEAELTLGGLVGELRVLLEEWQEKEYPSDEARYEGYYEDVLQVTERYDPCGHPGESCEDAHPDQSHEECIMQTEEEEEELQEKKLTSKARKGLSTSSFVFPKQRKFPIPDEAHGRNALSRANQYSSAPKWYDGSLDSLVKAVHRKVKAKFPGIETTEKSAKPGKG